MKHLLPLLILFSLVSCTTTKTDSEGDASKKGKYTTKKVLGMTYSRRPTIGMAQKADAAIMRFLLVVAGIGFVGALAGAISWWLEKSKKFPCPWWDELLVASGIVICIALLGILLYPWLKWILIAGCVGFVSYKILKGFRNRDKTNVRGQSQV